MRRSLILAGLGLAALAAALGATAVWFANWSGPYAQTLERFFAALGG